MIVLALRERADSRKIAARCGLGHGDSESELPTHTSGKESGLLLLGTKRPYIRRDQSRMQLMIEPRFAVAEVLLDQNLLIAKVSDPGTAVLAVGPHQQVALLPGLAKSLAIHVALGAPALGVRRDLLLKKPTGGVAEDVVLGLEDQSAHGVTSG